MAQTHRFEVHVTPETGHRSWLCRECGAHRDYLLGDRSYVLMLVEMNRHVAECDGPF